MAAQDDIRLDFQRAERIGFSEAIYCAGKADEHLVEILTQATRRSASLLLTRLSKSQLDALPEELRSQLDYEPLSRTAFLGKSSPNALRATAPGGQSTSVDSGEESAPVKPRVAVVLAGTSDAFVAREVERTLTFHGEASTWIADVGVAGLWRLTERVNQLRDHAVVIVVAGMDAALPTVVGGLIPSVIIAVPTSVGYGVAQGGETALRATLASCAQGVTVVNIDNGFGAACAALRVLRAMGLRTTE